MKNKINRKKLSFLAFLMIIALPMFAQPPGGGPWGGRQFTEDDVKERVKRQSQALEMNAEQEKKITDFEVEQYKKNQVEMQKFQGDREKMREHMQGQRELRDKKYEEVLTPVQFEKYKKQQEERRQEMQQRREQNQGAPAQENGGGDRPDRGRGRG